MWVICKYYMTHDQICQICRKTFGAPYMRRQIWTTLSIVDNFLFSFKPDSWSIVARK